MCLSFSSFSLTSVVLTGQPEDNLATVSTSSVVADNYLLPSIQVHNTDMFLISFMVNSPTPPMAASQPQNSHQPSDSHRSIVDLSSNIESHRVFCQEVSPSNVDSCLHPDFVSYCRNGVIIFLSLFGMLVLTVHLTRGYLQSLEPSSSTPRCSNTTSLASRVASSRESLLVYSERVDRRAYMLAQQLCLFSVAMMLTAVLLLPFSIVSHELVLGGAWHSYYFQWLTGGLLNDFWLFTSLGVNLVLFLLLPFSYFLLEAEGFAGTGVSGASFTNRLSEAFFCLLFTLLLVSGLFWTCRQIYLAAALQHIPPWSTTDDLHSSSTSTSVPRGAVSETHESLFYAVLHVAWSGTHRLATEVSAHLGLVHATLGVLGLLLLLLCSPAGIWAMVHYFIQMTRECWPKRIHFLLDKRQSGEEREQMQEALRLELQRLKWLLLSLQLESNKGADEPTPAGFHNNSHLGCIPKYDIFHRVAYSLTSRCSRPPVQTAVPSALIWPTEMEHCEHQVRLLTSELGTFERVRLSRLGSGENLARRQLQSWAHLLPLLLLAGLLFLCALSLLYVVTHILVLLTGWERLSETLQQPTRLGEQRSLSPRGGSVGVFIQMVLVVFYLVVSFMGLYHLPWLRRLRPRKGATSLAVLMGNCACLLLMSEALPLQVRILGITPFTPLPGYFVSVDWLVDKDGTLLLYNICYLAIHALCLFTGIKKPLVDLLQEVRHMFHLSGQSEDFVSATLGTNVSWSPSQFGSQLSSSVFSLPFFSFRNSFQDSLNDNYGRQAFYPHEVHEDDRFTDGYVFVGMAKQSSRASRVTSLRTYFNALLSAFYSSHGR